MKVVLQIPDCNGGEAYRQVSQRFGSRDFEGSLVLLQQITRFAFGEIDKMEEMLAEFTIILNEYDSHPDTTRLDDDVRRVVLLSGAPEPLRSHLQLNAARLSWEETMATCVAFLKMKRNRSATVQGHGRDDGGPKAMEVDAI